jgi:hypothetical protein
VASEATLPESAAGARQPLPAELRWSLPVFSLILTVLALFQLIYLAPVALHILQVYGIQQTSVPAIVLHLPEWLAVSLGLALAGLALWLRASVRASALLAAGLLLGNVIVLTSLMSVTWLTLSAHLRL